MSALAAIRPDAWGVPLFLLVLGALVLVASLALALAFLLAAWRKDDGPSLRLALRTITLGVLPAWIVLRGSAEWIADKEGLAGLDDPPGWVEIGYIIADSGFLLIVISSLLGWLAYRRVRAGEGGPGPTASAAAIVVALLVVVNVVALWAMTAKPA